MIDTGALRSISYGLFIVTSQKDGKDCGCVVNTFAQATSDPLQVSITINKENYTYSAIMQAKKFEVSILGQDISMDTVRTFGFASSSDTDKFQGIKTGESELGLKYLVDNVVASFSAEVEQTLDLGTHVYILGKVAAARKQSKEEPMTYVYYHKVKNGKTPPKASSYIPVEQPPSQSNASADGRKASSEGDTPGASKTAWRCMVCGHIEYVDELPDDFRCPICGVGKEMFERIEV